MSRKLFLDSRYAFVDYSGTYKFTFPTPLDISCLKLQYCMISNTHYNIMSGNQYLDVIVNINGVFTPYAFQLTPGNYSSTQLATMLNTMMSVANIGFNWTYNTNQYKLTLVCNYPFSFRFASGPNVQNSCNNVIGFNNVDTPYAASQTCTYIPDLLSPTYAMFWIKDSDCNVYTNTETTDSSYSFIIPFDSQKGSVQSWYEKTTFEQKIYMTKKAY